jgi:predicted  nucleic acid-binding Zn-ribbon protein
MAATTIVKKPAYGTRTPILAIAELDEPSESMVTLAQTLGKTMEESKTELETLKTSLAEVEAKIKELTDAEAQHLAEIEKMRTEKAQAEADQTFKERSEKLTVFGIEKPRDVLLSMSTELFAESRKNL